MDPAILMNDTGGLFGGANIASILQSEGPIVKCVLLKASCKSAEIDEEKVIGKQSNDGESLKEKSAKDEKNSIISEQATESKSIELVKNPTKNENDNTNTSSEENPTNDTNEKDKESEEVDEKEDKKDTNKESNENYHNDISEIEIDTTPKKSMVEQVLGGPFTFLGQYEDEGIVLMIRQQDQSSVDLPINTHKLQPPFHTAQNCIHGDILVMKVAGNEDDHENNDENNDEKNDENEFFQNYTKDSYLKFAARTDIIALPDEDDDDEGGHEFEEGQQQNDTSDNDDDDDDSQEEDEEFDPLEIDDDDDEEEDEDCQIGMMNLIFGQILKQFREENGRGPDTVELLAMRQALADKLGVQLGDTANSAKDDSGDDNDDGDDGDDGDDDNHSKRRRDDNDNDARSNKRVKFAMQDSSDEPSTKTLQPDENPTTILTEDCYSLKEGEEEI